MLKIRTSNEEFYRLYHQALEDMAALRLPFPDTDHSVFLPAAGLPWFVAPFGRDSLIVSLQNQLIYPEFARGALEILGSLQAKAVDNYRDAEPGKIPHEMRYGELAHFKLIPHTPYYGTADATPLYLITLHAAWRATGDKTLLERHLKVAEGCLSWIDQYGDRDGDGFQEYQTRSPAGYENMGWKDSGDCVVYPDGSLVKGPKALCELQGYVYDAWLRMAEVYDVLGNPARARELRSKAAELFERFNQAFWDDEFGFYAYALDGDKKKVLTVASNAGHCLWSGIVPPARARKVVERLMAPDMWSGWGIRTLSALHPSFNPYNYQTGSVWPHDNGIIAMGFKRYGFGAEAARIARDISARRQPFPAQSTPGTLHRYRARRDDVPGPISRRQRTAGLGRGLGIHADAGLAGIHAGRAARQAARRSIAAGLAARPHRVRPSRRQAAVRYPVLARWRGDEIQRIARRSGGGRAQQRRRPGRAAQKRARACVTRFRPPLTSSCETRTDRSRGDRRFCPA